MNINISLIGQMITFILLVVFTMKFVWPPLKRALDERMKNIANGLAAAEQGRKALETSTRQAEESLKQGRERAAEIIAQAEKRAAQVIDEARSTAKAEGDREKAGAKADIQKEVSRAREQLRDQVAALAVAGAEKILRREVDAKAHADLLDGIKKQL